MKVGLFLLFYAMVVTAKEKAVLDIVVSELTSDGEWYNTHSNVLEGNFSSAGSTSYAQGPVYQMHPSGLCNIVDDDELGEGELDYGWVGYVKMEDESLYNPCDPYKPPLYMKISHAMQKGASAMILDISDYPKAVSELHSKSPKLDKPIVLLDGKSAQKLMYIVERNSDGLNARISVEEIKEKDPLPPTEEVSQTGSKSQFVDMGIFLGCFVLFCIICIVIILKFKFRQQDRQMTILDEARQAVDNFRTHRFRHTRPPRPRSRCSDLYSLDSNAELCAVCIEEYKEGQELIVLPCGHEFHKQCVYSWLIEQRTCPLCVCNVLEHSNQNVNSSTSNQQQSPEHSIVNIPLQSHHLVRNATSSDSMISLPAHIRLTQDANLLHVMVDGRRRLVVQEDGPEPRVYRTIKPRPRTHFRRDYYEYENIRRGKSERVALIPQPGNSSLNNRHEKCTSREASLKSKERPLSDTYEKCRTCQCSSKNKLLERTASDKDLNAEFATTMLASGGNAHKHSSESCQSADSCDCHADSNQSTYGSSDTVPSDVSSCDSTVYRSRNTVKDNNSANDSEAVAVRPQTPQLPATRLKPHCIYTRHKCSTKTEESDSSVSSLEHELHLQSLIYKATAHRTQQNPQLMDSCVVGAVSPPVLYQDSTHNQCNTHTNACGCKTRHVLPGIYTHSDLQNMPQLKRTYCNQSKNSKMHHQEMARRMSHGHSRTREKDSCQEHGCQNRDSKCKKCQSKKMVVFFSPQKGTCITKSMQRDYNQIDSV